VHLHVALETKSYGFTGDKLIVEAVSQMPNSRLDFKAPSGEVSALDPVCLLDKIGVIMFQSLKGGRAQRLLDRSAMIIHFRT
jgi:hypothetical protein